MAAGVASGVGAQKIVEQTVPVARQDGFGMELHARERSVPVLESHNQAVLGRGGHLERVRKRFGIDDKRMVSADCKGQRECMEEPPAVVQDSRNAPVYGLGGADHASAQRFGNALMTEANAENGDVLVEAADELNGDSRLRGSAGTGREDDGPRPESLDLRDP